MPTLRELTKQSCHRLDVPACHHAAAEYILDAQLDRDEVAPLLQHLAAEADKSDQRPTWADVLQLGILGNLDEYYRHGGRKGRGDNAVPGFSMLIDKMGHAANHAK